MTVHAFDWGNTFCFSQVLKSYFFAERVNVQLFNKIDREIYLINGFVQIRFLV